MLILIKCIAFLGWFILLASLLFYLAEIRWNKK